MKTAVLGRVLPQAWPTITHIHPPLHLLILYRLLLSLLAVIFGLLVVTRTQPIPDPFAAYLSSIQGKPQENAALSVIPAWNAKTGCDNTTYACFRESGSFSMIHVTFVNDDIESVRFILGEDSLTTGDLMLLWGRPGIQFTGHVARLSWSEQGIAAIALAPPDCGGDIYFAPVVHITFSNL